MYSTNHRPALLSVLPRVLLALVAVLALAGCVDGPGSTQIVRNQVSGEDVFHSRARLQWAGARFECLASDSGHCHYAVFDGACGSLMTTLGNGVIRCASDTAPSRRFSLAVGERRDINGLPFGFRHCSSERSQPMTAECLQPVPRKSPAT